MRSLISRLTFEEEELDQFYDTFDVCGWDDSPNDGHLSIRHVQVLEERGVHYGTMEQIAERHTKKLFTAFEDEKELFMILNKKRAAAISKNTHDVNEKEDSYFEQICAMARANLDRGEPVFKRKLAAMIKSETTSLRDKVCTTKCNFFTCISVSITNFMRFFFANRQNTRQVFTCASYQITQCY